MRTRTILRLSLVAVLLMAASAASAHLISGTPDAPAHNANHLLPALGLAVLAGLIGVAAHRCFRSE